MADGPADGRPSVDDDAGRGGKGTKAADLFVYQYELVCQKDLRLSAFSFALL
jgi:hypothetical protein